MPSDTSGSVIISMLPHKTTAMGPTALKKFFISLKTDEFLTEEDIQHPKFQSFLNKTSEIIPHMSGYELLTIAIGIMNCKALQQNEINGKVRDALILKLREIRFQELVLLDFNIYKSKSTDFYETIQLKIHEFFLTNVENILFDANNGLVQFNNLAAFITRHIEKDRPVYTDILKRFASAFLARIEFQQMMIHEGKNLRYLRQIIKLFSRFNVLDAQSKISLNSIIKVLIESCLALKDVELMLSVVSESRNLDKIAFDSEFIPFVFNYLDGNCDKGVLHCYEYLMKMGHGHRSIDCLSKLFEKESFELDVHIFIQMCSACGKYDYKPSNWETSICPALQSFDFRLHIDEVKNFNWPEFVWKLHSLGHCDTELIEAVLGSSKFKKSIYIDYVKMIQFETLIESLQEIFGSQNIMVDHQVAEQRTIPFLLLMNLETKDFLPIAWKCYLRRHEQLIGIIIPEEIEENDELKPIESDGNQIKFIKLIPSSWLALPESERKSFLLKQIDYVVCSET